MRYFKKVKQIINLYNAIIKRFDNDLTDNDTTVFSRYIRVIDLHNNFNLAYFFNKKLEKSYKNAQSSFHKWNRRSCDVALNEYIDSSIKYIEKQSKLSERLNAYNELFRDQKAGFYHDSDKKMIDILTNEQLMRLIFAITLK
jgi:hypothetical protein